MRYCCYCGSPITEPARFCPMCGAQLPFEVYDETIHSIPAQPQPLPMDEPEITPATPETIVLTDRIKPKDWWKMSIAAVIALAIILTGLNHTEASGVEGTWKATENLSDMDSMMGYHASAIIKHFFNLDTDQVIVSVELNEDNTMSFIVSLGDSSLGAETTRTGTYEVHSDDTISLYVSETATISYLFGQESGVVDPADETLEFNYSLDGNKLTLRNDEIEVQLDKSILT